MKKAVIIGLAAVLAAGAAMAQDDVVMVGDMGGSYGGSEVESTVELALMSSYVWRGQVLNNDAVLQPSVTVSQYGVSLNIWGNYDLGSNVNGVSTDFSEIDFSLAYTLPIDVNDIAVDIGVIGYHFPANGDDGTGTPIGAPSTTELFVKGTVLSWVDYFIVPSLAIYGDVDEAEGVYILFDVVAPYQVSEYLSVEGGFSAGWGNTRYNDYYWGAPGLPQDAGFNDYNFYANVSYEIIDNLTAWANITATIVEGGSLSDGAEINYEDTDKLWGGVGVAYDF